MRQDKKAAQMQSDADDILELQTKERILSEALVRLEKQIFTLETHYLEDTQNFGNVMRGWDAVLTGRASQDRSYRTRKVQEKDRLFSSSSVSAPKGPYFDEDLEDESRKRVSQEALRAAVSTRSHKSLPLHQIQAEIKREYRKEAAAIAAHRASQVAHQAAQAQVSIAAIDNNNGTGHNSSTTTSTTSTTTTSGKGRATRGSTSAQTARSKRSGAPKEGSTRKRHKT